MPIQYLELNPWHKRQATLLYHFTSMEYLKGVLPLIDDLIQYTDQILDERAKLDTIGLAKAGWKPHQTAGSFSTNAYPALVDFRESVVRQIARRSFERYSSAGDTNLARMLREYAPYLIWATHEQEAEFQQRVEKILKYAAEISYILKRPTTLKDFIFWRKWQEYGHLFPRIPRFRVRSDVEANSGATPPRTGVYVPQEDPYAALQFAWTGGYGELGDTYTLNAFGQEALKKVGRSGLWGDEQGLLELIRLPQYHNLESIDDTDREKAHLAPSAVSREGFEAHPCRWYFVEMVNDEYEEIDGTYAGTRESQPSDLHRQRRVAGGERVPQSGWWYTPAKEGSRRYFAKDAVFPVIEGSHYGETLWQWSPDQSSPKL